MALDNVYYPYPHQGGMGSIVENKVMIMASEIKHPIEEDVTVSQIKSEPDRRAEQYLTWRE